jgi:hypothetical protein
VHPANQCATAAAAAGLANTATFSSFSVQPKAKPGDPVTWKQDFATEQVRAWPMAAAAPTPSPCVPPVRLASDDASK